MTERPIGERAAKLEARQDRAEDDIAKLLENQETMMVDLAEMKAGVKTVVEAVKSAKGDWHKALLPPTIAAILAAFASWFLAHMKWI